MSYWPREDTPGAGTLDVYELDAACWLKRSIALTPEQAHDMDDTAGLCSGCGSSPCVTPQACERAEPLPPVEPPRWVGELLAHPWRWSFRAGALLFIVLWITKP